MINPLSVVLLSHQWGAVQYANYGGVDVPALRQAAGAVRLASPRRVLDDRVVFVDSGSSAGHGDAPRCGSVAHVSYIGRIVKYYLSKSVGRVSAHHVAQKFESACWQCLHIGNSVPSRYAAPRAFVCSKDELSKTFRKCRPAHKRHDQRCCTSLPQRRASAAVGSSSPAATRRKVVPRR